MKSHAVFSLLTAAFLAAPLVCSAQRAFGSARSNDKTLLTGPYLLSPASPPESPVAGQQWTFVKAANAAEANRAAAVTRPAATVPSSLLPRGAYSLSERVAAPSSPLIVEPNGPAQGAGPDATVTSKFRFQAKSDELDEAREKLRRAKERLQRLRAEREAALTRRGEAYDWPDNSAADPLRKAGPPPPLPYDPIRFDAFVPATPTHLLPDASKPRP